MYTKQISFWVDKEQHQQGKRAVFNEALAHISDGRVSPIVSTLYKFELGKYIKHTKGLLPAKSGSSSH